MEHKVKVTVLDKKLYPELQQAYCMNPDSGYVPATTWGMSSSFAGTKRGTISGTWE